MIPRSTFAALAALAACADLELPEPPDLAPLELAYRSPTLALDRATAEAALSAITGELDRLDELDQLRPLGSELVRLHDQIDPDGSGDSSVRLAGVPLPVDARVDVFAVCPLDPEFEAIELTFVIRDSELVPTLFGALDDCGYSRELGGEEIPVSVTGAVATFLPNVLDKSLPRIVLVDYALERAVVDGRELGGRDGDFRLAGDRLEILVAIAGATAVGFREPGNRIGLRAGNGEWSCSQKERTCDTSDGRSFSF